MNTQHKPQLAATLDPRSLIIVSWTSTHSISPSLANSPTFNSSGCLLDCTRHHCLSDLFDPLQIIHFLGPSSWSTWISRVGDNSTQLRYPDLFTKPPDKSNPAVKRCQLFKCKTVWQLYVNTENPSPSDMHQTQFQEKRQVTHCQTTSSETRLQFH